ncbi:hypothetical protein ACFYU9_35425 [Streptomyces sp. NPDC004327]|uniref:hypothetical protein n=1 Tax=Streptomyces sp. NPDC004327 TaxID=3364699 RepID=UPI0036A67444
MVYDRNVEVARHERLIAKGSCRLELDDYLEALIRKPGAFPGATAPRTTFPASTLSRRASTETATQSSPA